MLMEHIHALLESQTQDEADSEAKRIAFECLARFAESHYDSLGPYAGTFFSDCGYALGMSPGAMGIMLRQEEPEEVKAAALEFLVNVALSERERADSGAQHMNFICNFGMWRNLDPCASDADAQLFSSSLPLPCSSSDYPNLASWPPPPPWFRG